MARHWYKLQMVIVCIAAVALLVAVELVFTAREVHPELERMHQASSLASRWFQIVSQAKEESEISLLARGAEGSFGMLGAEFSEITTTLGSFGAKAASLNPEFAALFVRVLSEAGIDSSSVVGLTISGSFPGGAISALAAIQTMRAKAVVVSSLGSSSYGANQPEATWIDMERWLHEKGGLQFRSTLVTFGGEGDSGGGIADEGIARMEEAAERCSTNIFVPRNLSEAIDKRLELFEKHNIGMLINIGGNQAILGSCRHSDAIPNGFHESVISCKDADRGVIVRLGERGIPVFHFLRVENLAAQYKLHRGGDPFSEDFLPPIYEHRSVNKISVSVSLMAIAALVYHFRRRR